MSKRMKKTVERTVRTVLGIAALCLLLTGCSTGEPPAKGESGAASPAVSDASAALPESPPSVPPPSSSDASAPEDAPLAGAVELQTGDKINPGCRSTLYYPLRMQGESTATDFSRWSAEDLDGNPVTEEILKGSRLTLVHVWSSYCGAHFEDLKKLQALYERYDREQLNVIGIFASSQLQDGSTDENEVGYARYLLEETGAAFPQLLPSDDLIAIRLHALDILPEAFFLDEHGKLVAEGYVGSIPEDLAQTIDRLLEEPTRPAA